MLQTDLEKDNIHHDEKNVLQELGIAFGRASRLARRKKSPFRDRFDSQVSVGINLCDNALLGMSSEANGQNSCEHSANYMLEKDIFKRDNSINMLPHPSNLRKKKTSKHFNHLRQLGWDVDLHLQQIKRKAAEYQSSGFEELDLESREAMKHPTYVHIFRNGFTAHPQAQGSCSSEADEDPFLQSFKDTVARKNSSRTLDYHSLFEE